MRKHEAFCYGSKTENGSESPSPQPSPNATTGNILNTCEGEREQTGIVDEPVLLREVGVVNPIAERMNNISELDRFPLLGERVRVRGLCLCLLQPLNDKPSDRFRLIDI